MSDREEFDRWATDKSFLFNLTEGHGYISVREMAWEVWQAAQAKHKPRDTKKWRVDDLVEDIKGNVYIIAGVKASSFLVKDTEDNLYLMPADELTWHSRPQQEQQK